MKIILLMMIMFSFSSALVIKNYDWRKKNDSHVIDLGTYGLLYTIKEKSLMKEIEEKAKTVDWVKQIKAFKDSKKRIFTAKGNLPLCQKTRKRDVFIFNTLKYPIYGSDGKILYNRGFKYNVLSLMNKNNLMDKKPMLFFNLNEVRQVQYAKLIEKNAHLYMTDGYLEDSAKDNLKNVYVADSLIDQFQIECTPSIYIQKKDRYEVYEIDNETLKQTIMNEKDRK